VKFPNELIFHLRHASNLVVLTGAGVSQESGLRTFRDSQTGLWAQYKPEDLASPQAFERDPKLIWDWYAWRREAIKSARPNPGHYSIVEIEKQSTKFTLVTQNVDGLHRMAGNQNVIELHGNIHQVRCSGCGKVYDTWKDDEDAVPRCDACGEMLRPDVVWFGESLPLHQLETAFLASTTCDVFLSIGTSGVVQPAASLAYSAQKNGAIIVEINAEATPLTSSSNYFLQGKSGTILPELVKMVWN